MGPDGGGVESRQPKGPEDNTRHTAANRPGTAGYLHEVPSERGGAAELVGLAPRLPGTFAVGALRRVKAIRWLLPVPLPACLLEWMSGHFHSMENLVIEKVWAFCGGVGLLLKAT